MLCFKTPEASSYRFPHRNLHLARWASQVCPVTLSPFTWLGVCSDEYQIYLTTAGNGLWHMSDFWSWMTKPHMWGLFSHHFCADSKPLGEVGCFGSVCTSSLTPFMMTSLPVCPMNYLSHFPSGSCKILNLNTGSIFQLLVPSLKVKPWHNTEWKTLFLSQSDLPLHRVFIGLYILPSGIA